MNTAPDIPYSLVIPAYNEENRIRNLFDTIGRFDGELIVVCDGTDGTARVIEEIIRTRTDLTIRCLTFDHRLGKGGGVFAGLSAARAPLVGFCDADGSTTMSEMLRLFSCIGSNDGAIGSRWVDGSTLTVRQGLLRRLESRSFNILIRCLFGLDFHDTQCGAKVFRKTAIDRVLPAMVSRGFEFDVELLWRLRRTGCRVIEVPIEWQNKTDSRVRKRDMMRMVAGLFRARLGIVTGMTAQAGEDQKKEAFRLFEEGRYQESLQICTGLPAADRDAAVEVLTATNLYYTKKPEDAEVCFRDLLQKMPDSSYVHSYLGKILEERGDEGAVAEYATAVHLDPTNQDALRSYAEYLLSRQDYRGALPVLRHLVQLAKKPGDVKHLMRAFIETGDAEEALALHATTGGDSDRAHEYIDALSKTRNYQHAAESALKIYRETNDPAVLRKYLGFLSGYDVPASLAAYATHAHSRSECDILFDYILLLKSTNDYAHALDEMDILLSRSIDPVYRMVRAGLLAALGRHDEALASYEQLVRDELGSKNDLETLGLILGKYRGYLMKQLPATAATERFLSLVSRDVNVASLLETARLYEDQNNETEARAWYYRAYRTDYLAGGLAYARFLSAHGEDRECEKVMLYILSNVKKGEDLVHVASVILDELGGMFRLKRLMDMLVKRLEERRATLDSRGLELLAMAFFITASNALEETDYPGCKYYCLCGIDVMPAHTTVIQPGDFLRLIHTCKEKSVADRPIMNAPRSHRKPAAPAPTVSDELGLDGQEQKIVVFLRSHRKATEMELRTLLATRRVVGIVNRLVQKAAKKGVHLIEKKGVGENGEIYESPEPEPINRERLESINIINALRRGTVPASGLERIAVGLDIEEDVIGRQLDYVAQGGGDTKFIRGEYGSGKTFLVARALEIARSKGFVTSQVVISSQAPLHKLRGIYQQIAANLRTKEEDHALKTITDNWLFAIEERLLSVGGDGTEDAKLQSATEREIETSLAGISEVNTALAAALRTYYRANNAGDFALAQAALGWIAAEPNIGRDFKQKTGLRGDIDDAIAFTFLRGLIAIIHGAGYQGLAIAVDEMETTQGLQRSQREKGYQTLVQIIDALDKGEMPRCYFLFTGTPALYDGSRGIRSLPPLHDRICVVQDDAFRNPRQPQIILSKFDTTKLEQVALKVLDVYAKAYSEPDRERVSHRFIRAMIRKITTRFGGRIDIIPRIFLKEFVDILDKCELYDDYNPAEGYDFDAEHLQGELKKEEEAVMVVRF